ncbi:MAG: T9SS type A sorting domain-containing protein, partial [Ignavibacteriae bacterium]|nr:T9SS type A sorting domain-containing protein [Ignavibacteriota bacterium]
RKLFVSKNSIMSTQKIIPKGKILLLLIIFTFFTLNSTFSQWQNVGSVSGLGNWPSIFTLDQSSIFIVGGVTGPVIWRSTNGGTNFTQLPTNGLPSSSSNRFLTCVWATGVNTIYVGDGATTGNGLVKNAKVYKTTNGGTNWTTILNSGTNIYGFINGVVFSRTNTQLGVANCDPNSTTEKFKMWKTTDGGTNWTLFEPDAPNSCGAQNSVFLIDENFYGFGLNTATARVAVTSNGGTNFSFYNIAGYGGDNGFVSTVAFGNDKLNGMAATSQTSTTIARTTNGGLNWFSQTIPCTISGHCNIKWVPDLPVAYLVVSSSSQTACLKTTDNGANWTQYTFPSGASEITHIDLLYNNLMQTDNEAYIYAANKSGSVFSLHEFPMPVKLFSFSYYVSGRNTTLKWVTSEELNNSGFEVYRISDAQNQNIWQKLGFVKGKGTTNTFTHYSFEDKNLNTGKYCYRIKQIDYNGNYEYFNLEGKVEITSPVKFNLSQNYPNPFNPSTKISYALPDNGYVTLKIYDMLGKEVATLVNENKNAGYYDVSFSNTQLSAGVYFYKLNVNDFTSVKKMVFVK